MNQFRLNGKPYPLATCWADLSAVQVLALAPYLYAQHEQGGVKLKVLRIVCPQLPARKLALLTSAQRFDLCQEVAWIWTEELGASAVDHFHHRGRIYLLPAPNLEDAVALEYAMASIYFRSFAHPQRANPKALDQLVATLCRPERAGLNVADPNWDGQRRERFNGKIAEARAGELADLPVATKIVVLQHFLAAQRFIHRGYQALYKKAGPVVPTPGTPAPASDGSEVLEMIHALAERGTYGTYEETAYTGIHTLFYNLNKQAVRRREEE